MNGPIGETAWFTQNPISVTVQTSPSGRSFTVDGTTYTSAQTFSWTPGSSHTIATTSPQSGSTGVQYVWSSWSDGGAMSHTVSPASGTTHTANFTTQYYLTMSAGTGGTVSPSSGWRNSGASVSISATPNSGYSFSSWTGSGSGSYSGNNNPASITMNGPISESAAFVTNALPRITAARQGGNVVLSWQTNAVGFSLVSAADFTSTNWTLVSPPPTVLDGQNFVTNPATGSATFYRLRFGPATQVSIVKTGGFNAGNTVGGVALSPDESTLYVAFWEDQNNSRVQQFSLPDFQLLQTIEFGGYHTHGDVVVSADGCRIFTPNYYYINVSQVILCAGNARSDLSTTETWPGDIDITPDRNKVLVAVGRDGRSYDMNNDGIAIYDISAGAFAQLAFVRLDDEPSGHKIGFSADSGYAYVVTHPRKSANPKLYEVSLASPYQITRSMEMSSTLLQGVACSGNQVFVSDDTNSKLWVIDRTSWTKTSVSTSSSPGTIAVHPNGRHLFALLPRAAAVVAIDTTSMAVVGRYDGLQSNATDIEFNASGTKMYISHYNTTGDVFVFDVTTPQ